MGPETCQDNDAGVWYKIGAIPGRTMVLDGNSSQVMIISVCNLLYIQQRPTIAMQ
ncbi:MAG: hypothetical protein IPF63_10375 [Bacteroidetes bacterium]|nr:hypothetical protein [Bacteroidota bacterium]